jgi:hypothetical protein
LLHNRKISSCHNMLKYSQIMSEFSTNIERGKNIVRKYVFSILSFLMVFLFSIKDTEAAGNNYDHLVPVAKKYIGVPYAWGGTSASGFDCSGYLTTIYKSVGVSLPRTSQSMYSIGTSVSKANLRVGDLVFFNTYGSGVSHVGMYIGNNEFIHASSNKGVTISNINDPYYWKSRYIGAKRVLSYNKSVGEFKDVRSTDWVYPSVNQLAKENLIVGYESSYYKPNNMIRRSEVAGILAEAFELKMNNRSTSFPDVPSSHWAVGVVNAVYQEGIFNGSGNQFKPDEYLTRGQMAAILVRAFDLNGNTGKVFNDVPSSHWAHDYVSKLIASGITTGYPDNTFKPENRVTRAQFAAFVHRALY